MKRAYLAAFRGQGGILTSYGVDRMAAHARRMGYEADVYGYRGAGSKMKCTSVEHSLEAQNGQGIQAIGD